MGKRCRALATPVTPPAKVLFMHRDPRDTVVSFFHQMTKREPLPPGRKLRYALTSKLPPKTIDTFVRSSRFGIEKVVIFNLACAQHLQAYPVSYEDMVADTVGTVGGILSYLGHDMPACVVNSVVADHTFPKMRAREAKGELAPGSKSVPSDPDGFKVRRGKVEGWTEEMLPHTQDFANEMLSRHHYFERMQALLGTDT